jgi:aryl-alcohol dehydrogenase-like predicted oxidoreductase
MLLDNRRAAAGSAARGRTWEALVRTRQLGTTDMHLSVMGFGAWAIGGPDYAFGWGQQEDHDSVAAIHRALDLGINWIDTAAVYGLGRSERVVARALKELGSSRRPYVFTKGSLIWDDTGQISHSLKPASLRKEVDDSLRRLDTDVIDMYQLHWSKPFGFVGDGPDVEEGWQTLVDLKREGKVRHIAVSNFAITELERARAIAPVASLQPPYSMIRRGVELELLPYCQAHNVGVITYSPMAAGILTGSMTRERAASLPADDWRSHSPELQEPKLSRNLALVETLRAMGARHGGVTAGAVAVAWVLRHPAVTAAIVGFRKASQVDGIMGAASLTLTDDDVKELEPLLPAVKKQGT